MKPTTKYVADNGVLFDKPESALQADFCHAMQKFGFSAQSSELILEKFDDISALRAKFISAVRGDNRVHHRFCATHAGNKCTCDAVESATQGANQ